MSESALTVTHPPFTNRNRAARALRNYRIRGGDCSLDQPIQTVGPPAP